MSCYFLISIWLRPGQSRAAYDDYIEQVKPLVEGFGGRYLIRSEQVEPFGDGPPQEADGGTAASWRPDRLIVIEFADRAALDACFSSSAYRAIQDLRRQTVDTSAVIVEGL